MYVNSSLKICILILSLSFASCATVKSTYISEMRAPSSPKKTENVEYLPYKPHRAVYRIGIISVGGNGYASFEHIIKEAKRKAAAEGADFITLLNSGVEQRTVYSPGYSTYQSSGSHGLYGYGDYYSASIQGYGRHQASAYSIGPSINTYHCPWGNFSAWIYAPSRVGIHLNDGAIVTGFYLNSDAEVNDVKIGDKVLGINGFDIQDHELISHLLQVYPGDKIQLAIERGGVKVVREVTAIKN